ncbi:hypothetical protein VMCG_04106 [Cytospora schulzeri]|uniref:Uncharacterized protein n=1 Tax=Cytospora schulzeri TaxID=448051 RepID=A0A423WTW4_9PEZI|nr:hypothetical protein VMCG_04106 [Valsa malicola]
MHFHTILFALSGVAMAEVVLREPQVTEAPAMMNRGLIDDLSSDLGDVWSNIDGVGHTIASDAEDEASSLWAAASKEYTSFTAAAASATSSLGSELATATGPAASAIESLISGWEFTASSAAAVETAGSVALDGTSSSTFSSPSTSGSSTASSSSTSSKSSAGSKSSASSKSSSSVSVAGSAPLQTAAVGIGALIGGVAALLANI